MTFLILTYTFVMAAKKQNFYGEKKSSNFCRKFEILIFNKNATFFRFFHSSSTKIRRTAKRPTVLSSLLNMLTILITFRKIYFLTKFIIFCRGCITFLRKMEKIKNFQVRMPIDWKLNNELNGV